MKMIKEIEERINGRCDYHKRTDVEIEDLKWCLDLAKQEQSKIDEMVEYLEESYRILKKIHCGGIVLGIPFAIDLKKLIEKYKGDE